MAAKLAAEVAERPIANPAQALRFGFVLAPKFTLVAFAAFVDTLRLAADDGDRSRPIECTWTVVSHDMQPIASSCGVLVHPTGGLLDPSELDYLVVVGGLLDALHLPMQLQHYLAHCDTFGVPLVGVCTGSFVLAQLGLLQGYRACVSWFHVAEFQRRHPHIAASADTLYLVDRKRLTCAGGTSVVHLAAHLLGQHDGAARAQKALRIMIAETPLPSKATQPQPLVGVQTQEARVRKVMLLLERNLSRPLPTEYLARHVGLSVRQLQRLFKLELGMGPTEFALKLRLAHAHQQISHSQATLLEVARQCGFTNPSHFTRSFRAAYGQSPGALRKRGTARAVSASV